jgi:histidyl-tRNA synthetase
LGSNDEKIALLTEFLKDSEIGLKGIEELQVVLNHINRIGLKRGEFVVDVTLARGLNYYTGAIFEVKAKDVKMGSICGGGRYDDLTGLFGLKGVSGVGISFGADRIYDVLNELNLFPSEVTKGLPVLFVNFGEKEAEKCLDLANELRANNIACEVYPSAAKLQKQMKYANDRNVQFVILIGENELNSSSFVLKNMETGEQTTLKFEELSSIYSLLK